ncbi:MAG: DUF4361 domain-containing protein [Paludibacter sp.]|nr:DUF4361 domain-containing protein [Paludibacter sp.]
MNKIINKVFPIMTMAFVLTLTACLNDSDYADNLIGTKNTGNQNFVEVHLTSSDNTNTVSRAYDAVDADVTVDKLIPINLTSGPATKDVTITFELLDTLSSDVVKSYVLDDGLVIPDLTKITILNTSNKVTIPAGSSTGYISIKFNPKSLIGATTIFAVKITAISDSKYSISNMNIGYVKIGIKNQWDGLYEDKGYFIHPSLGKSTFDYSGIEMATIGANTVEKTNAGDRAIVTDITITPETMVVDGVTVNKVTIALPAYPGANSGLTDVDDSGNKMNYYNPATKTFELFYWYNSAAHRVIRETLIYEESR